MQYRGQGYRPDDLFFRVTPAAIQVASGAIKHRDPCGSELQIR